MTASSGSGISTGIIIGEIPLSPQPQTFAIELVGVVYNLTVKWNPQNATWIIDIADVNSNPLVQGIPLVTGCDLLEQYAYLGFGGALIAQTENNPDVPPAIDNLGQSSHVYFVTLPAPSSGSGAS